jgi:hypothetical protein
LRRVSGVTRDSHCTFIAFYNGQLFAASADWLRNSSHIN